MKFYLLDKMTHVSPQVLILLGVVGSLLVILVLLFRAHLRRQRLRIFLHQPLPCSVFPNLFPKQRSLFDILMDLGVSRECLEYVFEELKWVSQEEPLRHSTLDRRVKETVSKFGDYVTFIETARGYLRGQKSGATKAKKLLPTPHEKPTTHASSQQDLRVKLKRALEEREAFNRMITSLIDETKTDVARRLGIIHRFDFWTGEAFRAVAENDKRAIAKSLDYETNSNAEMLLCLGKLSVAGGVSMLALDWGAEALEGVFGDTSGDVGDSGDLGDLGELALILGAISIASGVLSGIGKAWRERNLKKYQTEFRKHMEYLSETYFGQERGHALRVPRLVFQGLELEKQRLSELVENWKSDPIEGDTKNVWFVLGLAATTEAQKIIATALQRFQKELGDLIKNIRAYAKAGRQDLAGIHLYLNRALAFLPSQVPEHKIKTIQECERRLMEEVVRLKCTKNKG